MKHLAMALFFAVLSFAPATASDPLSSLRFLVGNWTCTYHAGKTSLPYKAAFSYDLGGNWLRERDWWKGGGADEDLFTYDPKRRGWTAIVIEQERAAVVFHAAGSNPNHVVYRSVYPDTSMTDVFDRTSLTRYTLNFTQTAQGKTIKSTDVCVKS
jgi:hypothetical protein